MNQWIPVVQRDLPNLVLQVFTCFLSLFWRLGKSVRGPTLRQTCFHNRSWKGSLQLFFADVQLGVVLDLLPVRLIPRPGANFKWLHVGKDTTINSLFHSILYLDFAKEKVGSHPAGHEGWLA